MKSLHQCASVEWDVAVIGGGCTGAGILRDLSMRGLRTLLLEQQDLAHGTSSRFHGLLHSGARYAVSDPEAGRECIEENKILRRIGAYCVELTEGFFVRAAQDDPDFEARWVEACSACGIAAVPLSVAEARRLEPNLASDIRAVYRVPDSGVDGFRLVWQNALSARRHGGAFRTYAEVIRIRTANGKVCGVEARDTLSGETVFIPCSFVVNAAGSRVARIAAAAGLDIRVQPDKGSLVAFNHRFTERVINRLRKASDGDIFVPHGSITILGTTSRKTDDPDDTRPDTDEVRKLLDIGRVLFPRIDDFRILRAFAGTRPLFAADPSAAGRGVSRGFKVIDHASEGVQGMISVCGGKLTTYRLMAEKTADMVCAALGNTTPCRTAKEPLVQAVSPELRARAARFFPAQGLDQAVSRLGDSFEQAVARVESAPWKKALVCECELVTLAEFEQIASEPTSRSLGDIRRRTRMGMGTCQGSFCGGRGVGALIEAGLAKGCRASELLREFQQERWSGFRPVLWGHAAREIELGRGIYAATLNIDGAVPSLNRETAPEPAALAKPRPDRIGDGEAEHTAAVPRSGRRAGGGRLYDVVVVGAGFAGLTAAAFAAARGAEVCLISRGMGALSVGGGSIDVLGYLPDGTPLASPFAGLARLGPRHPYTLLGEATLRAALEDFKALCAEQGYPYVSDGENNRFPITAAGSVKPVFLTPFCPDAAAAEQAEDLYVAGPEGLKDFHPRLITTGLSHLEAFRNRRLTPLTLAAPFPEDLLPGARCRDLSTLDVARFLDKAEGRRRLAELLQRSLKQELRPGRKAVVLLPPVLGTQPDRQAHEELRAALGVPVQEVHVGPPAVTGLRLRTLLLRKIRALGVDVVEQAEVTGAIISGDGCKAVETTVCGRKRAYAAKAFIIATGGIYGGGVEVTQDRCRERIFDLEIALPEGVRPGDARWSSPEAYGPSGHLFASIGVRTDAQLHPVNERDEVLLRNVFFVGRALGGYDGATEKSGNGVALAGAWSAALSATDQTL